MQKLGDKLRILRQRQGLSVRQLAAMLDINSHSHIVAIETGKSKPSLKLLVKMMDLFDVSCDKLLRDEIEI